MKYSKNGYKRNSKDVNNPYNIIDSGNITMEGVDFPVMGIDNLGNSQLMMPGANYQFPGNTVFEVPLAQKGFEVPKRKGVRKNPDGTESTHLMRTETLDGENWFSFPSLFQDEDGTWIDMSEEEDWMNIYEEAKRRGEVIDFGTDKEAAIKFGEGSWKTKMQTGGARKPIAVTDPADPRLHMYLDSLNLYQGYLQQRKLFPEAPSFKGQVTRRSKNVWSNEPIKYYQDAYDGHVYNSWDEYLKDKAVLEELAIKYAGPHGIGANWKALKKDPKYKAIHHRIDKPAFKNPEDLTKYSFDEKVIKNPGDGGALMKYYDKLSFRYPTKVGSWHTPDLGHVKIKPIDSYAGEAWNPIYAKPKQPFYYTGSKEDVEKLRSKVGIYGVRDFKGKSVGADWGVKGTTDPNISVDVRFRKMGMDSSFKNRKDIAINEMGMDSYSGTSEQNKALNKWVQNNYTPDGEKIIKEEHTAVGSTPQITTPNIIESETTFKESSNKPAIEKGWIAVYGNASSLNPQGEIIGYKNIYTGGFMNIENWNAKALDKKQPGGVIKLPKGQIGHILKEGGTPKYKFQNGGSSKGKMDALSSSEEYPSVIRDVYRNLGLGTTADIFGKEVDYIDAINLKLKEQGYPNYIAKGRTTSGGMQMFDILDRQEINDRIYNRGITRKQLKKLIGTDFSETYFDDVYAAHKRDHEIGSLQSIQNDLVKGLSVDKAIDNLVNKGLGTKEGLKKLYKEKGNILQDDLIKQYSDFWDKNTEEYNKKTNKEIENISKLQSEDQTLYNQFQLPPSDRFEEYNLDNSLLRKIKSEGQSIENLENKKQYLQTVTDAIKNTNLSKEEKLKILSNNDPYVDYTLAEYRDGKMPDTEYAKQYWKDYDSIHGTIKQGRTEKEQELWENDPDNPLRKATWWKKVLHPVDYLGHLNKGTAEGMLHYDTSQSTDSMYSNFESMDNLWESNPLVTGLDNLMWFSPAGAVKGVQALGEGVGGTADYLYDRYKTGEFSSPTNLIWPAVDLAASRFMLRPGVKGIKEGYIDPLKQSGSNLFLSRPNMKGTKSISLPGNRNIAFGNPFSNTNVPATSSFNRAQDFLNKAYEQEMNVLDKFNFSPKTNLGKALGTAFSLPTNKKGGVIKLPKAPNGKIIKQALKQAYKINPFTLKTLPTDKAKLVSAHWLKGYPKVTKKLSVGEIQDLQQFTPHYPQGRLIPGKNYPVGQASEREIQKLFEKITEGEKRSYIGDMMNYTNKPVKDSFWRSRILPEEATGFTLDDMKDPMHYLDHSLFSNKRMGINSKLYGGYDRSRTNKALLNPFLIGLTGLSAATAGSIIGGQVLEEPVKNAVNRKIGFPFFRTYRSIDPTISYRDTTINLNDNNLTFGQVNDKPKGRVLLGGDFIDGEENTVRTANQWLKSKGDTYGDEDLRVDDVKNYYGIEGGKLKVGKATDFKPKTKIVPNRYDKGQYVDNAFIEKMSRFNKLSLTDKNGNPIYHNSIAGGKIIFYSKETGESIFMSHDSNQKAVNTINNFIKNNKRVVPIIIDNGRFRDYMINEDGITNENYDNYYSSDFQRGKNAGYNIIIKKEGGFSLGDEVPEHMVEELRKQGYTLEEVQS